MKIRWPWISREKHLERIAEAELIILNIRKVNESLAVSLGRISRSNEYISNSNRNLSDGITDSNKYARSLEKLRNDANDNTFIDYGESTKKNLIGRIEVTRIDRPQNASRDFTFQITIPEDWERTFESEQDLSYHIEREVVRNLVS